MAEHNKWIKRRLIEEVWNQGNFTVVDQLIASDYLGHSPTPAEETHGRQGYQQFYAELRQAFPDFHATINDQISEGDRVVTRWTASVTHMGEFEGIQPTGKRGKVMGIAIDRVAAGKVVECWTNLDGLSLLRQLGDVPEGEIV